MSDLRRTSLYDFNRRHGARFVPFAGWEMPVQYSGILEEHRTVRRAAGLFDVSHMGEAEVKGPDAVRFLNYLVTNDVSRMAPGRALYTPMCDPDGGVIDDLLVYRRAEADFLLCLNAANAETDLAWMREHVKGFQVELTDRSDDFGLLALQGPESADILGPLTEVDLASLVYYHFVESTVAGAPALISRTGYTGEDGFELFVPAERAEAIAEKLMERGRERGMALVGLGARDSLRLEAGYPLHGHEISREITPLEAGLDWTVKLKKPDAFIGKTALISQRVRGLDRCVVFFRTGDRRIVRPHSPVRAGDREVGRVLSGTLSPILNESIGSALVEIGSRSEGLSVEVRGQAIELRLVKPPFIPLKKKTS